MKKAYVWMAVAALAAWVPATVAQAEGNHQASGQQTMEAGHTHASHHKSDCDKDKKADEESSKDGKHVYHERTDNPED